MTNGNALRLRARLYSSAVPSNPALALALPVVMNSALQGDVVSRINGVTAGTTATLTDTAGGMFALAGNHLTVGATSPSGTPTVSITETDNVTGRVRFVTHLPVTVLAPTAGSAAFDRTTLTSVLFADEFTALPTFYDPTAPGHQGAYWDTIYNYGARGYYSSRAPGGESDICIAVDPLYRGLGLQPFSQEDSVLTIIATKTPDDVKGTWGEAGTLDGYEWYTGMLASTEIYNTPPNGDFYVEIRWRMEVLSGFWGDIWLLPVTGPSAPPEMDVVEIQGAVTGPLLTAHQLDGTVGTPLTVTLPDFATAFHTGGAVFSRSTETVSWILDGQIVKTESYKTGFMDNPWYILVTGGPTTGYANVGEVAAGQGPTTREIDYIRVYSYTGPAPPYGSDVLNSPPASGAGWYPNNGATSTTGAAVDSLPAPAVVASGGSTFADWEYYNGSLLTSGKAYLCTLRFNFGSGNAVRWWVGDGTSGPVILMSQGGSPTVSGAGTYSNLTHTTVGSHEEISVVWSPGSALLNTGFGPYSATAGQTVVGYSITIQPAT